jgi:hypothetical protein
MYSREYGYSNSSKLMDIGPQSLGAEEGGLDWADATPANEMVKRDNRVAQARTTGEQLEFFMISPDSNKQLGGFAGSLAKR